MFGNSIPTPPPISKPTLTYLLPKPIFVMRFRNSMSDGEFRYTQDQIHKSDIANEYHVIVIRNDKDKDEFEMFNAEKVERQEWNQLINKIIK
jgi:hypothetical protein